MLLDKLGKQKMLKFVRIIRDLEFLLYLILGVYGFMFLYEVYICDNATSCDFVFVKGSVVTMMAQLGCVVAAITNVFLIISNFELFDKNKEGNIFFKSSVIGLGVGYGLISLFFKQLILNGGLGDNQGIFMVLLLLFFVCASFLLQDKYSWDHSSLFVKVRLSVFILNYILFLVSPVSGLIFAFLLVGPILFFIPYLPGVRKLRM